MREAGRHRILMLRRCGVRFDDVARQRVEMAMDLECRGVNGIIMTGRGYKSHCAVFCGRLISHSVLCGFACILPRLPYLIRLEILRCTT